MRTIGISDYTVGEDCFTELPTALAEYGAKKVAIIGVIYRQMRAPSGAMRPSGREIPSAPPSSRSSIRT